MSNKFMIAQLDEIPTQPCPCGQTRRAFVSTDNPVATIHMVDIDRDARTHYHKRLTEIYLVVEGTGHIELDG
jgi:mannose-6-phosphate isomerase-like protein (cupin superfamily)